MYISQHFLTAFAVCAVVKSNLTLLWHHRLFSLSGSSVHGISQARILEWFTISFSRTSSWPRDQALISCISGGLFATEPPGKPTITICSCLWVAKSCLTLCKPMDCNMPGFSVLHYIWKFTLTHVHWVDDAIQLSHPLLQGLFQWVSSSHQAGKILALLASVFPMNVHGWFLLELSGFISCCPGDS